MTRLIEHFMTPHPVTIANDATLDQVKHLMYERNIRHLPVIKDGKIIGVISDRDLKLAFAVDKAAGSQSVEDECSAPVYTVQRGALLKDVCDRMVRDAIGSTVIVNSQHQVIGIFTLMDACRVLAEIA